MKLETAAVGVEYKQSPACAQADLTSFVEGDVLSLRTKI